MLPTESPARHPIEATDAPTQAQVPEAVPAAELAAPATWYGPPLTGAYDTVLDKWVDATNESNRQLLIYKQLGQMFRFLTDVTGFDRMDVVYFSYSDLDEFGNEQFRYGTSDTSVFLVLEAARDAATGGTFVTLWRGEV